MSEWRTGVIPEEGTRRVWVMFDDGLVDVMERSHGTSQLGVTHWQDCPEPEAPREPLAFWINEYARPDGTIFCGDKFASRKEADDIASKTCHHRIRCIKLVESESYEDPGSTREPREFWVSAGCLHNSKRDAETSRPGYDVVCVREVIEA